MINIDYKPKQPKDKSLGIGIIGAGEIVEEAHLPAYEMAGYKVVGIYNRSKERSERVAKRFNIPTIYDSIESLLADPNVQVVDIALPVEMQSDIVEKIVAAGKHFLCQKPLGTDLADAEKIANLSTAHNLKGAVNHQMRWAPGIQYVKQLVKGDYLGELLDTTISVNVFTDWENWPWITEIDRLEVMYHSIHYIDALRYICGMPEHVYAESAKWPGQIAKGESRTMIHLRWNDQHWGGVRDNHNNIAPDMEDWWATFRFEGTKGTAKGTNGALYNYPNGTNDTLSFFSKDIDEKTWITPTLEGKWFPDAFIGSMGELLSAIEEDREPENSVQDGVETIRLVEAIYQSMDEQKKILLTGDQ